MASGSPERRENLVLTIVALGIGLAGAAAYGAWRAVSGDGDSSGARWSEFAEAMLFPGALIIVAVAAMVWLGWKANID